MPDKEEPKHILKKKARDPKLALLLAVVLGPLGLLYTDPMGGILMSVLAVLIGVPTGGIGLILVWPVCILWTSIIVTRHTKRGIKRPPPPP